MKTEITKETAIKDLKELFNIPEDDMKNCYESYGSFGINKQFMAREEVLIRLQNYFKDKMFIKGLGLEVASITLLYTTFKIIELNY